MKHLPLALVLTVFTVSPWQLLAADQLPEPKSVVVLQSSPPQWEINSTWRERYVFSTAGVEVSNKPGIHTSILYFMKNGCYLNPWFAVGLNGWDKDAGSEVDLGGGCVLQLGKGVTLDLFAAHYNVYNVRHINNADIVTVAGELGWPILKSGRHEVKGYARVELLKRGITTPYHGDYLASGGIAYRYDQGAFAFRCKLKAVKDPGVFGLDNGFLAASDCGVDLPLNNSLSFTAGLQVTLPFMKDVRKDQAVPYAGIIARF